jgi:hypothetical protein
VCLSGKSSGVNSARSVTFCENSSEPTKTLRYSNPHSNIESQKKIYTCIMASPRRAFGVLTDPNGVRPSPKKVEQPKMASDVTKVASDMTKLVASSALAAEAASAAAQQALSATSNPIPPGAHSRLLQDAGIQLLSQIGEGGFGTVYMARCSSGQARACKMVGHGGDAEEMEDIAREVAVHERLGASTGAQFYVALYAHFTEPMRSILVMELCAGIELEDYTLRQPAARLSEREAHPVAAQLAAALVHCHDAGVVHLDVTPRNVLVDTTPSKEQGPVRLKLIDCAGLPEDRTASCIPPLFRHRRPAQPLCSLR